MAEESNTSQHILIGGVALGLIAAGLAGLTLSEGAPKSVDTSVLATKVDADELTKEASDLARFLAKDRIFADLAAKDAVGQSAERISPILFAPELWQVALDDQKRNVIIDIYDPSAPKIHAPIPNLWFIDNKLSKELSLANGALVDSDGDGFSNEEEYAAQTKPSDAADYPALVAKGQVPRFELIGLARSRAIITADSMLAMETAAPESVSIRLFKTANDMDPIKKFDLKPGESFGVPKGDQKRFTLVEFTTGEYTSLAGGKEKEMALVIRDNESKLEDKTFVMRAGKPRPNDKATGTSDEKGRMVVDTTAKFRVTAGSEMGKASGEVMVKLGHEFLIPGDSTKTRYIFESIDSKDSVNICPVDDKAAGISIRRAEVKKKK